MKTLTKKTTHIAKIRQLNASQIERVCELLGWTRMQYCEYQYDQYEKYIALLCADLPGLKKHLRYSPTFRGFFCNEWLKRNEAEFVLFASDVTEDRYEVDIDGLLCIDEGLPLGDEMLKYEYHQIHNAKRLFYDEKLTEMAGYIINQIMPYV